MEVIGGNAPADGQQNLTPQQRMLQLQQQRRQQFLQKQKEEEEEAEEEEEEAERAKGERLGGVDEDMNGDEEARSTRSKVTTEVCLYRMFYNLCVVRACVKKCQCTFLRFIVHFVFT